MDRNDNSATADDLAWLYRVLLGREPEDVVRAGAPVSRPLHELAIEMACSDEMGRRVLLALVQGRPPPHEQLGEATLAACEDWLDGRLPADPAAPAPGSATRRAGRPSPARLLQRLLHHPALAPCLLDTHGSLYSEALAELARRLAGGALRLHGRIEFVNREHISGWMADDSGHHDTLQVEIRHEGRLVACAGAHSLRPDIRRRLGGSGLAGFRARWNPAGLPPGEALTLTLHEASTGAQVGPPYRFDNSFAGQLGVAQLLAKEFDEIKRRLDALAGLVPQALGYSAFPLDHYDLYRRTHCVPPPPWCLAGPADPPMLHFTIALDAAESSATGLRLSADSLRGQQGGLHWALLVVGGEAQVAEAATALAAADSRIRHVASWDAAAPLLRAAAAGDRHHWIVLMQAGECLDGQALAWMAEAAATSTAAALYWDEDCLFDDADGVAAPPALQPRPRHGAPILRTAFDADSMLELNVVGTSFAARADHLGAAIGLLASSPAAGDAAEPLAHPLAPAGRERLAWALLRCGDWCHLPQPLLSRTRHAGALAGSPARATWSDPRRLVAQAAPQALQGLLPKAWQSQAWRRVPDPLAAPAAKPLVRWHPQRPDAAISVLIPTRDHAELLAQCIHSLRLTAVSPQHLDIVVADNGSTEEATLAWLADAQRQGLCRVLRIDEPFNWSRLNNRLAEAAHGAHLLFLNNDTRMLTAEWDDMLRGQLERSAVGAVGARLLYEDMTIQHAGVRFGHEGFVGHVAVGQPADSVDGLLVSQLTREVSAVTGAFLACRREVFASVGGFDAERLGVTFNDVDWCLRVRRAGLKVLYVPALSLIHYESKSRGFDFMSPSKQARADHERACLLQLHPDGFGHDPFSSPRLSGWVHDAPGLCS